MARQRSLGDGCQHQCQEGTNVIEENHDDDGDDDGGDDGGDDDDADGDDDDESLLMSVHLIIWACVLRLRMGK